MAFLMWAFLHTKTGTAMTAVGSNPTFAKAAGVNVDRMRLLSVVIPTWLGALGILVYEQGFGFIQLYNAPFYMALPAVSAILIGGASVDKASIGNVFLGVMREKGGEEEIIEVSQKLPYDMDGVIINLPGYLAGLPEEAYISEFIATPTAEELQEEAPPAGGDELLMPDAEL